MNEIETRLGRFAKRIRWMRAWQGLAIGGTIGAIVSVVLSALDFTGVALTDWPILLAPVIGGALLGALINYFRKLPMQAVADSIDRRATLENRLGTAVEGKADSSLIDVQRIDASKKLQDLKPATVYPMKFSRWHSGWMAICVVSVSIFLLGNSGILMNDQQKKDQEELQKAAKAIERVAKPLLERKPEEVAPEEREMAKKLEKLAEELKKGRMPKEDALKKANDLMKEADDLTKKRFEQTEKQLKTAESAFKDMLAEEMAAATKDESFKSDELMKEMEKLGPSDMNAEAAEAKSAELANQAADLQKQIDKMEKQLKSGKNDKGEEMSESEKEALEKALEEAKEAKKGIELSKKVQDMIKALMARPEYKEMMEMMKKMQQAAQQGKQGQQGPGSEMTEEEIREMMKKLEELADKLNSPEAMSKFLKEMMEALKKGCGS